MRSSSTFSRVVNLIGLGVIAASLTACVPGAPTDMMNELPAPEPAPAPAPTPPAPEEPVLFVANFNGGITAFKSPASANGNIAPSLNLRGTQTQFANPWSVAVDNHDALLVVNYSPGSVTAYENARAANGNLAPARNIFGAATQLAGPTGVAFDRQRDLLYVCIVGGAPGKIMVYDAASTARANGNLAPIRTISSAGISSPYALSLAPNGDLYVANTTGSIAVFADPETINGTVSPTRVITSPEFAGFSPVDVFITGEDEMLVLLLTTTGANKVATFGRAGSLNGAVNASAVLTVSGSGYLYGLTVDSGGVGYLADSQRNAIYAYDDIATLNATLPPNRTIMGDRTQLAGPKRMFILE